MAAFQDRYREDYHSPDPMKRTYERESDAYKWREMPQRVISPRANTPLCYGPERKIDYMYEMDAKLSGRQPPKRRENERTTKEDTKDNFYLTDLDLNVDFNTEQHHTEQFDCASKRPDPKDFSKSLEPELIVRRGQSFFMTLHFNDHYQREKHEIRLTFTYVSSPDPMKNVVAEIDIAKIHEPTGAGRWHMRIVKIQGFSILLEVMTPENCIVGEWTLRVYSRSKTGLGNKKELFYEHNMDITILMNPWNKTDNVYMDAETCSEMGMRGYINPLDEYVLKDSGVIFRGISAKPEPKAWFFGQYEPGMLKICTHIMRKAFNFQITKDLGDPVTISRAISHIIANNEGGIMTAKWSGDYHNGGDAESPNHWQSSEDILRRYREKGGRPVKYGQCWVFSALAVTVCRALGLPCRSVTNYFSSRSTKKSLNLDVVKERNQKGELEMVRRDDTIWTFHTWNDVWMMRMDLPDGFDGWQVIDPTPQDISSNKKCSGPAPLTAVKNGLVDVPYDTDFIFSQINGDRVSWEKLPNGKMRIIKHEPLLLGTLLVTKIPDGNPFSPDDKENVYDLTRRYKFPEASVKERYAVSNARDRMNMPPIDPETVDHQELTVEVHTGPNAFIGSDVYFTVKLANENRYRSTRTIERLVITVENKPYCGGKRDVIKKVVFKEVPMKFRQVADFTVDIQPDEYLPHLKGHFIMDVNVDATIMETGGAVTQQTEYRLLPPVLRVQGPRMCAKEERIPIALSFRNPLRYPLTNCSLEIVTNGVFKTLDISDVFPGDNWTTTVLIVPPIVGRGAVLATFECNELPDMNGSHKVEVIRTKR